MSLFYDACDEFQCAIAQRIIELFIDEAKSTSIARMINLFMTISEIKGDAFVPPIPPHDTPDARLMVKYRGFIANLLSDASKCEDYDEDSFCNNLGMLANSHTELKNAILKVIQESIEKAPYPIFQFDPNLERQLNKIRIHIKA